MVDGLFLCATLTGRRGGLTQAGAETFDTGAEADNSDQRCSWEDHSGAAMPVSGMKVRSVVGLSDHSAFHWWSAQCDACMLVLSDRLMSCCAVGTNGCLDLRCRAFALDGQVSAEWNWCLGSIAQPARESMASLRRSSAGWMPARMEGCPLM